MDNTVLRKFIILTAVVLLMPVAAMSQRWALKTNIIGDAALSPNVAVEVGLAPKWTFDLSGQFNAWTIGDGHKWKHWVVQPEARYWLCERFSGHFSASMPSADNIMWVVSALNRSTSSAPTSRSSPTAAIRAGAQVRA